MHNITMMEPSPRWHYSLNASDRTTVLSNLNGAACFREGRFEEAMLWFRHALSHCHRGCLSCPCHLHPHHEVVDGTWQETSSNAPAATPNMSSLMMAVDRIPGVCGLNGGGGPYCCRSEPEANPSGGPFSSPHPQQHEAERWTSRRHAMALSAPIEIEIDYLARSHFVDEETRTIFLSLLSIFNLAFALHTLSSYAIASMEDGGQRDEPGCCFLARHNLGSAFKLYKLAYLLLIQVEERIQARQTMFEDASPSGRDQGSMRNDNKGVVWRKMILFATLHAMGLIQEEFQNHYEARFCYDNLFSSFITLGNQGIQMEDFPPYFNVEFMISSLEEKLKILHPVISAPCA
jgi:hypothetical protein